MAKLRTSIYIDESTLMKADQLVMATRAMTRENASVSSIVETLIVTAFNQLKRVEPIRDGNKIVGWTASYGDHLVTSMDGAGSKPEAERALDAYVFEELSK